MIGPQTGEKEDMSDGTTDNVAFSEAVSGTAVSGTKPSWADMGSENELQMGMGSGMCSSGPCTDMQETANNNNKKKNPLGKMKGQQLKYH